MADSAQQVEEPKPAGAERPEAEPRQDKKPEQARKPKKPLGRRMREHPLKVLIFLLVLVGIAIGAVRFWNYIESYQSTDDAQIDGDIYPITTRIAGTITAVYVQDNQPVKAGETLVELDPKDYQVALNQAQAALQESKTLVGVARPNVPITSVTTETTLSTSATDVAAARAAVAAAQRDHESALADVQSAEADGAKAQADLERYRQLVEKDEISRQQYDQAVAAAKSTAASVDAKKAAAEAAARSIEEAQARLEQAQTRQVEAERVRPDQIAIQNATVQSREATAMRQQTAVDQALLNLSYTKIVAPIDGVIGHKNAEPGQQVAPGQQLMSVVPLENIWVTANFKETELRNMRPNQRVTIHVDTFGRDYEGYVESVGGATGAKFSLLPPENATGNYVKVVQRIPVRIRFKPGQDPNHELRPGMSVEPKVWLRD